MAAADAGSVRAVVLAAGLGQRLRPLTENIPKPLLPIGGSTVVERTLERLQRAGVESVALNLHHLGNQIREHLGDSFRGMPLVYSVEDRLLGTLGALTNLRDFLQPAEAIVVVNGDSICDWPVEEAIALHRRHHPWATLLVSSYADPERFGGGVGVNDDRLASLLPPVQGIPRVFAGLQVFSPRLLEGLPIAPLDTVRDLHDPALQRGEILCALESGAPWFDLGTPRRYLEAGLHVAREEESSPWSLDARVANGAEIRDCLILSDARIGADVILRDCIIGPGVDIPSGSDYASQLLTQGADGLVATPI